MSGADITIDAGTMTAFSRASAETSITLVAHWDGAAGSTVVRLVAGHEVTIGRSRQATIWVDHEKVSRIHTRIVRRGDAVFVTDAESRNGTRINGVRIDGEAELRPGDELTVGPLTASVARVSRLRTFTAIVEPDAFEARLTAEADRGRRYQRPFAIAALRVMGGDEIPENLARSVREMDLVADYGSDVYMVLLPELPRGRAVEVVRQISLAIKALGGAVRSGVVCAPEDGDNPLELISKARAALRAATPLEPIVAAVHDTPVERLVLSPQMTRVYEMVKRVADATITVLINGETGVGKELVAEALAQHSTQRSSKPLVKLNCASLPETLLESELFGHERGAFTGADRRKIGYFEAADSGTLFLDEIGEIPLALQAKLLRVLERKVITRVGGTEEIAVDTRVVAATHRDLEAEVRAGRFREDLYFRIAAFSVVVPPLRDRKEEIVPLAELFAKAHSGFARVSDEAKAVLQTYDWPGNVRELKNAIERACVLMNEGVVGVNELPERVRDAALASGAPRQCPEAGMRDQVENVERNALVAALVATGHNQTKAAQRLGISRRALIYKMEKYGLKAAPVSRADGERSE